MTVVYLVQHGDKQPGPGDPGLTGLGRVQATRTGRWLDGLGIGALWTSPMRRARETAGCIAAVTGLAVQVRCPPGWRKTCCCGVRGLLHWRSLT